MPRNDLVLRASWDKVLAPDCWGGIKSGAHALQVRRVAAEKGRSAAATSAFAVRVPRDIPYGAPKLARSALSA